MFVELLFSRFRASCAVDATRNSTSGKDSRATSRSVAQYSVSSTIRTILDMKTSGKKTIPHSMNGEEVTRAIWFGLQLLAQTNDMCVHGPRVRKRLVAPHGIQDHVPGERTVRILQKKGEEVVLSGH